jgi:hypothetical protein
MYPYIFDEIFQQQNCMLLCYTDVSARFVVKSSV